MIQQHSLLIVANQSLLGDILENLLMSKNNHQVYRVTPWEYKDLLSEMYQRDLVVMVVEEEALGDDLYELVTLVHKYGRLRIITVSSESNEVQIYTGDQATMAAATDLIALVNTFVHPVRTA